MGYYINSVLYHIIIYFGLEVHFQIQLSYHGLLNLCYTRKCSLRFSEKCLFPVIISSLRWSSIARLMNIVLAVLMHFKFGKKCDSACT